MTRSRLLCALVAAALLGLPVAGAQASNIVTLTTSFQPNKLGSPTSLLFGMKIADSAGGAPTPISNAVVRLPAGMGVDTTGVSTCSKATLQASGPSGCPTTALIGVGSTTLEANLGGTILTEMATLTPFLGPPRGGHVVFELYGNGQTPISYQVTLEGVLQPDVKPYGQQLVLPVPTIPTVPGGPNASVIQFQLTVGASNIQYYRTVTVIKKVRRHGRIVRKKVKQRKLFHVRGIVVPKPCPAGGFPFSLILTYQDGTSTTTNAAAPCP